MFSTPSDVLFATPRQPRTFKPRQLVRYPATLKPSRRWQIKMRDEGRCQTCGSVEISATSTIHCESCRVKYNALRKQWRCR